MGGVSIRSSNAESSGQGTPVRTDGGGCNSHVDSLLGLALRVAALVAFSPGLREKKTRAGGGFTDRV
jgi:hypothetical protein